MTQEYDVIVVGGGMVGAALGCCLGGSDLRIAVLEDNPPEPFHAQQPFDLRVSALSLASVNIFKVCGAWEAMREMRVCPYRTMRVWEERGETVFHAAEIGEPVLGYIVENRIVQLALSERLKALENVDLLSPAVAAGIAYGPGKSSLQIKDGTQISARLLVAADGGTSAVRSACGIGVSSWDYEQHALVAAVETVYQQRDETWQRFTPQGPQAFLPLPGPHASLVWYESPERIRLLKQLSSEQLRDEWQRAFPSALGDIAQIQAVGSFPLRRQHALRYVKDGIALIGDAAHMIHPLAGQGVNIGILDAAALAEVLVDATSSNRDFGMLSVLKPYEQSRKINNAVMMTTMDLFHRVFTNPLRPIKLARDLGLGLANRLTPAKRIAMRYAMGLEGRLPRMARGDALV